MSKRPFCYLNRTQFLREYSQCSKNRKNIFCLNIPLLPNITTLSSYIHRQLLSSTPKEKARSDGSISASLNIRSYSTEKRNSTEKMLSIRSPESTTGNQVVGSDPLTSALLFPSAIHIERRAAEKQEGNKGKRPPSSSHQTLVQSLYRLGIKSKRLDWISLLNILVAHHIFLFHIHYEITFLTFQLHVNLRLGCGNIQ